VVPSKGDGRIRVSALARRTTWGGRFAEIEKKRRPRGRFKTRTPNPREGVGGAGALRRSEGESSESLLPSQKEHFVGKEMNASPS